MKTFSMAWRRQGWPPLETIEAPDTSLWRVMWLAVAVGAGRLFHPNRSPFPF